MGKASDDAVVIQLANGTGGAERHHRQSPRPDRPRQRSLPHSPRVRPLHHQRRSGRNRLSFSSLPFEVVLCRSKRFVARYSNSHL
ncbi:unnamed protein product, partial [Musa hybrid cultivar]